ncbi:hypothetical protein T06_10739 [Trichinella sp. T6]|nr:hypothetical protein T06_10739 [Trichinella sp. T6]
MLRTVAGFCTLAILKYNLPDVRSSGNESGLYDVDSSWPTEYGVVKKEIAYDQMQADRNTANIRSFYSVTNNQRKALRRQQRTASQYITGRNNSTRNRWLFKTTASSTNFDSYTDVNDSVRL